MLFPATHPYRRVFEDLWQVVDAFYLQQRANDMTKARCCRLKAPASPNVQKPALVLAKKLGRYTADCG